MLAREGLADFAIRHFNLIDRLVEEEYQEHRFTPFGDIIKISNEIIAERKGQVDFDEA